MADTPAPLLEVDEIGVRFGGVVALEHLSFSVELGTICALIGPNGAGKTTLFNVVSRLYEPSVGHLRYDGSIDLLAVPAHRIASLGITRTFQNLALVPGLSVLDNVLVGAHSHRTESTFLTAPFRFPAVIRAERAVRAEGREILERLEIDHLADRPADGLPYGTLKRIELARALASHPRLLMLDEPATGLTHREVDELSELIHRLKVEFELTLLLVEHHMAMVMGISDRVVVLDFGTKIADGPPSEVQRDQKVIEAYLGAPA